MASLSLIQTGQASLKPGHVSGYALDTHQVRGDDQDCGQGMSSSVSQRSGLALIHHADDDYRYARTRSRLEERTQMALSRNSTVCLLL